MTPLNQSPQLSKTNSIDEKSDMNINPQLKRPKSNSVSSETGITMEFDSEVTAKRPKLDQIDELNDESSPKTSESNLTTI
jgi:hypothetical protein